MSFDIYDFIHLFLSEIIKQNQERILGWRRSPNATSALARIEIEQSSSIIILYSTADIVINSG